MGTETDTQDYRLGQELNACDIAMVQTSHIPLEIQRRSRNYFEQEKVDSFHPLVERVENVRIRLKILDRDGQEVEVFHSGVVAEEDTDIVVRGVHVCRHVERDGERPEVPQQLHGALFVHSTDEKMIAVDYPLRARYNAPDEKLLLCVQNNLRQLTERKWRSQVVCIKLKLLCVSDGDILPTDVPRICMDLQLI